MTGRGGAGGRGAAITLLVVLGAAALLFTGLAVHAGVSRGRPWALTVISPVITGIVVWLILRAKTRRASASDATAGTSAARVPHLAVIVGVTGLALMGLAVFLISR